MHRLLKRGLELTLCHAGVPRLARRQRAGDTLILAWHNIVPHGAVSGGDTSLHLPQRAFARQLDVLVRTHDIVPIHALYDAAPARRRTRPRAVLTFDDAYRGALTAGVEELRARRLPATVFVAPAFVGGRDFWWDALTELGSAALSPGVRSHALHELAGRDEAVRAWATRHRVPLQSVPEHMTCANEADLRAAQHDVSYASHTWSHLWLPALGAEELRRELAGPRDWLAARFRDVVDCVAYPYGGCSSTVAAAAEAAGYQAGFLVEGGWLGSALDGSPTRYALPRYNVPAGLSVAGFELRTSGVLLR